MISIITVGLNPGEDLVKTIKCLLNQSYEDWELVYVDGGSTDNSIQFLHDLKDDRISIYVNHNMGIYESMNFGKNKSKNPIVTFLNCGDYYFEKNLLTDVTAKFDTELHHWGITKVKNYDNNIFWKDYTIGNYCHQSIFYNKTKIDFLNYDINYELCADFDLTCKIMLSTKKLKTLNLNSHIVYDLNGISSRKIRQRLKEKNHIILKNVTKLGYRGVISLVLNTIRSYV